MTIVVTDASGREVGGVSPGWARASGAMTGWLALVWSVPGERRQRYLGTDFASEAEARTAVLEGAK